MFYFNDIMHSTWHGLHKFVPHLMTWRCSTKFPLISQNVWPFQPSSDIQVQLLIPCWESAGFSNKLVESMPDQWRAVVKENILQKNNINGFQKILIRPPFVFMTAYIRACMDSTSFLVFFAIPDHPSWKLSNRGGVAWVCRFYTNLWSPCKVECILP